MYKHWHIFIGLEIPNVLCTQLHSKGMINSQLVVKCNFKKIKLKLIFSLWELQQQTRVLMQSQPFSSRAVGQLVDVDWTALTPTRCSQRLNFWWLSLYNLLWAKCIPFCRRFGLFKAFKAFRIMCGAHIVLFKAFFRIVWGAHMILKKVLNRPKHRQKVCSLPNTKVYSESYQNLDAENISLVPKWSSPHQIVKLKLKDWKCKKLREKDKVIKI